jgi:hypothetical protein
MDTIKHPHHALLKRGFFQKDPSGKRFFGPFNGGNDSIAYINHYFVKSKEEFMIKVARGKASQQGRYDPEEDFQRFDLNHVLDRTALDFFEKKK